MTSVGCVCIPMARLLNQARAFNALAYSVRRDHSKCGPGVVGVNHMKVKGPRSRQQVEAIRETLREVLARRTRVRTAPNRVSRPAGAFAIV